MSSSLGSYRFLGMFIAYGSISIVFLVVNTPFVIASLIFASQDSTCATSHMEGIPFNLRTWLLVDSFFRILVFLTLLITICYHLSNPDGTFDHLYDLRWSFIGAYGLFTISWVIVGGVIFWGKLAPSGACEGQVSAYTNSLLIITLVIVCCISFFVIKMIEFNND